MYCVHAEGILFKQMFYNRTFNEIVYEILEYESLLDTFIVYYL